MSKTIRFPLLRNVPSVGRDESSLVVNVLTNAPVLSLGGANGGYVSCEVWKTLRRATESPYTCFALEFTASAALVIGNGTFAEQIGLYGAIVDAAGNLQRTLLGALGMARGGVAPQIPIVLNVGSGELVGYTEMVSDLSLYDFISVGGVAGDIAIPGGETVTVRARPIRAREYLG
jgi:hypothetical protein